MDCMILVTSAPTKHTMYKDGCSLCKLLIFQTHYRRELWLRKTVSNHDQNEHAEREIVRLTEQIFAPEIDQAISLRTVVLLLLCGGLTDVSESALDIVAVHGQMPL